MTKAQQRRFTRLMVGYFGLVTLIAFITWISK